MSVRDFKDQISELYPSRTRYNVGRAAVPDFLVKKCWCAIGPENPKDQSEIYIVRVAEEVGSKADTFTWLRTSTGTKVKRASWMIVRRTREQARADKDHMIKTLRLTNHNRFDYYDEQSW